MKFLALRRVDPGMPERSRAGNKEMDEFKGKKIERLSCSSLGCRRLSERLLRFAWAGALWRVSNIENVGG